MCWHLGVNDTDARVCCVWWMCVAVSGVCICCVCWGFAGVSCFGVILFSVTIRCYDVLPSRSLFFVGVLVAQT